MPNLRELDLVEVNYVTPTSVGVDSGGQMHQLSLDWKNKRESREIWDFRRRGIFLRVSKEKALFLDAKDCATKLRIVAPSATKMHLNGCGALRELDIDCRLLLDLVFGNYPPTIMKMVERFRHKCPWLKKFTLEIPQKKSDVTTLEI